MHAEAGPPSSFPKQPGWQLLTCIFSLHALRCARLWIELQCLSAISKLACSPCTRIDIWSAPGQREPRFALRSTCAYSEQPSHPEMLFGQHLGLAWKGSHQVVLGWVVLLAHLLTPDFDSTRFLHLPMALWMYRGGEGEQPKLSPADGLNQIREVF